MVTGRAPRLAKGRAAPLYEYLGPLPYRVRGAGRDMGSALRRILHLALSACRGNTTEGAV